MYSKYVFQNLDTAHSFSLRTLSITHISRLKVLSRTFSQPSMLILSLFLVCGREKQKLTTPLYSQRVSKAPGAMF